MPFTNEVIGTNGVLIRNWLQSENYVAGVSGWKITKAGNAEFGTGTFRGTIESGPLTGQHFIVNNTVTRDPLDIYNTSNQLVFSINRFGVAESHNPTTGVSSGLQTGNVEINDGAGNNNASIIMVPATTTHVQTNTEINCSPPIGATYTLNLLGGSDDGALLPTLVGNERNIQGSVVQSDQRSTNNLMHAQMISCTTNANGDVTLNHNCSFTPKVVNANAAPHSFTQQGVTIMIWQDLTTSSTVTIRILTSTGAAFNGTMNVMFTFWG